MPSEKDLNATPGRKAAASAQYSLLIGIALLFNSSACFAQEYQGASSGSRGTTTVSRINPRSPLSLIRRSVCSVETNSWAASNEIASLPVQNTAHSAPIALSSDSWASAVATPKSQASGHSSDHVTYTPPITVQAAGSAGSLAKKHTKFDRRYLNFPHPGINQVNKYPSSIPMTGNSSPGMAGFDNELCAFMRKWQIPGASMSIVKNGKVLYSRAYGYADLEDKKPVQPYSVFRIGSISKTLTSVAVLKLVEERKLELSSPAIALLRYHAVDRASKSYDQRIKQITIQNLLQGTGGWDRSFNGDPMFMPLAQQAAQKYSNTLRPTPESIIRYQLDRPLDFEPGTKYSYSNLGYSILGEIISKTTSQSYADYVKQNVLAPMGLHSFQPGKTRVLAPNEVCYYGYSGENKGPSIFPNIHSALPLEYGGDFYLEAMTADCGWIGTTTDIAKFVSAVFGGTKQHPLQPATVRQMIAKPALSSALGTYFAMGWEIDPPVYDKPMRIKKEGCLPGSTTLVLHRTDGSTCAIAFNSRPQLANVFQDETQKMVEKALNSCKTF
ncbi:MAG: beta-lactamase family protein [Candidatus Obscuribacterales bacterium]|nr:beta-lactamase family protein [Candidatus Obscuribacterales bacterium]